MKQITPKSETMTATTTIDHFSGLKAAIIAAIAENDAGLLRAESSQAPFNATRLLLTGRREALEAVQHYLDGDSSKLDDLATP